MKNILNKQFNSLTAIRFSRVKDTNAYWIFKCKCGNEKEIAMNSVCRGMTKTCGCTRYLISAKKNTKHGFIRKFKKNKSNPRFYAIWSGMRNRCQNVNNRSYQFYGHIGIKVEDSWNSFEKFYKDMYKSYVSALKRYRESVSIDRIDNTKGYSKENCRWATNKMQGRNKTTNTILQFRGRDMCISEFIEKYKINRSKFYRRIKKGIDLESIYKELKNNE